MFGKRKDRDKTRPVAQPCCTFVCMYKYMDKAILYIFKNYVQVSLSSFWIVITKFLMMGNLQRGLFGP
jgi:hypothetical protein